MYKYLITILSFMIAITACNCAKELNSDHGFVYAKGQRIAEGNGNEIIFKGVGLGGWMLQEGYLLGTQGPQHEIRAFLEEMAGTSATNQFYEDWLGNFVNQNDVKQIAQWGYNSIRLPMHYELFLDSNGKWIENSKGIELTDKLLGWCKAERLYLILDLHAAPGGQGNNQDISDRRDGESLWTSDAARDATLLFWYKLAEYYRNEKWIAGYDLLNEPNYDFENTGNSKGCACKSNTPLLTLYQDLIDTIRSVDKNHLLIIEGNCYGSNYNGLESLASYDTKKNIALSFHNYWSPNTVASTQDMLNLRNELNVPLWRGEIGENSNTWFTEMVQSMESLKIGYANWPWKKINTIDGPVVIASIPEWDMLIKYKANNANPKPTQAEAQTALKKLSEGIKIENCKLMNDVAYSYLNSPYGNGTKPYRNHAIPGVIYATDYDMGMLNEAWFDTDYQNISGSSSNNAWNNGEKYRNDGVDIWETNDPASNGYYVGKIVTGEWLLFSLESTLAGNYSVTLRVKGSQVVNGEIHILLDEKNISSIPVNIANANQWIDILAGNIKITSGEKLKIYFAKGGFDLCSISFDTNN